VRALAVAACLAAAGCGRIDLFSPPPAAPAPDVVPRNTSYDCADFPIPNPALAGLPNAAAYTDNGDGTITDQVTGLTWEAAVEPTGYSQDEAVARCTAKGEPWRLPTRIELASLVDFTVPPPGPTIDAIFRDTPGRIFWTASLYAGDPGDVWTVGFDGGYSDYGIRNLPNLVRCVRAPAPSCPATRFEARAGGLVLDHGTGLLWQQQLDPGEYTWSDARAYCAGQGPGWRVPSLKELESIIDDEKEYPAVDPTAFPDTPSAFFWSSSSRADGSGGFWYVDFFYGATDGDVPGRLFRVRCVR
jgi:hypothetical protein